MGGTHGRMVEWRAVGLWDGVGDADRVGDGVE